MVAIVTGCLVAVFVMRQRDRTIRAGLDMAASRALNPELKSLAD